MIIISLFGFIIKKEPKIKVNPDSCIEVINEPVRSVINPAIYGPIICPMLKHDVKIAVDTINVPENLFCPSNKDIEVIGTKVIPNIKADNIKINGLLIVTDKIIPIPINKDAIKSAISLPIL